MTDRAMSPSSAPSWPVDIHAALNAASVRQVAYVPDAGHARLIDLCAADRAMTMVPLTSEEEGVAVLAGAWLGGVRGVLLMQSSGLGNCVNMLSLARTCRFPLLMLVTMRGQWGEFNPWQVPMGQVAPEIVRACGGLTLPLEQAEAAGETMTAAARMAFEGQAIVAILIAQRLIGAKTFGD
ncbi:MAG: phosphonopyruvate decarboxylase [Alphaproteobacteria bacterium]|nr:MAG: phosphonopyruvate decarboxylase [Alphaproteobacteria bacterium]